MQCDLILVKTTNIQQDDKEVNRTISPAKLQPAKRDQVSVGRSNRFGFRQNVVRPTTSIQPRISGGSDYADNVNNNIRLKSASHRTNVIAQPEKVSEKLSKGTNLEQTSTAVNQQAQNEMNANTM